jgi:hypothetical protein
MEIVGVRVRVVSYYPRSIRKLQHWTDLMETGSLNEPTDLRVACEVNIIGFVFKRNPAHFGAQSRPDVGRGTLGGDLNVLGAGSIQFKFKIRVR